MSDINSPGTGGGEVPGNQPPAAPPPPPSGGGTPPPPPGGGTPPPPPPVGGGNTAFTIGNAFNWGWSKFQQNLGPILIATLIYLVIGAILYFIFFGISSAILGSGVSESTIQFDETTGQVTSISAGGPSVFLSLVVNVIGSIIIMIYGYIVQAGVVSGALEIARGKKIELGDLLPKRNVSKVVIAGVIVSVLTGIGYLLCFIPGLIVAFFSAYFVFFIQDQDRSPMDAIKDSWSFVNKNLGTLIGFFLASVLAYIIGALICGIGLLVAVPVVILAQTFAYRTLNKEEIAA